MSPEQFLRPGCEQEKLRFVLQIIKAVREVHKRMARPLEGRKENHFASVFEQEQRRPGMTFGINEGTKSVRFLVGDGVLTDRSKRSKSDHSHRQAKQASPQKQTSHFKKDSNPFQLHPNVV